MLSSLAFALGVRSRPTDYNVAGLVPFALTGPNL
jgi:hypothetical protein